MILTSVLQAMGLFAATNIDDIIVLSLFFARGAGQRGTTARILAGQYLGFAGILGAAVLVTIGAGAFLPSAAIPYFGLIPLGLGLWAAWQAWRGDDDDDAGETTPKAGATTPAAAATAAPTFAADSTMGKIVAAKKITFGVKFDQPGFGVKDPVTGKLDGFDIAIAKELGKSLGLTEDQIKFEEAISKNRIPYLQEDGRG